MALSNPYVELHFRQCHHMHFIITVFSISVSRYPHYPADILCPHTHTHTTLQIYSVHTHIPTLPCRYTLSTHTPTLPCRYTLTDLPVKYWPVMQLSLVTQQGRSHQRLLPLRRTPYSPLITLLWCVVVFTYLASLLLLLSGIAVLHIFIIIISYTPTLQYHSTYYKNHPSISSVTKYAIVLINAVCSYYAL